MKLFKESRSSETKIKPSEVTQEMWDTCDYALIPISDDIPIPWDAVVTIVGNNLEIEGSVTGGSASTPDAAGYCKVVVSKDLADKIYEVEEY